MNNTLSQLGIYVHIPFCKVKCSYCHFFTFAGKLNKTPLYFKAVLAELKAYAARAHDYTINTIYIGGGTPSLVDANYICEIVQFIHDNFNVEKDVEVTIEMNPESTDANKLAAYSAAGINRVSMGLQAWQDHILKYLNRLYTAAQFQTKLQLVKDAGFTNINLDLIFGIPGQTMDDWKESIENVLKCDVNHLSCYSLELDNDSHFGKLYQQGIFTPAKPEVDRAMYDYTIAQLTSHGYIHYETSNFCEPGQYSRHNLAFWKGLPYLGIGAAAHSYFENKRYSNIYSIEQYTADALAGKSTIVDVEDLNKSKQMFEYMMLRLRLLDGFDTQEFQQQFNLSINDAYPQQLAELTSSGLLAQTGNNIRLTSQGMDLYNQVIIEFMD